MKILCYIQPVLGLGPLYRTLEILKEFPDAQIQLVTGGKSFKCDLPTNVKHTQLPELYMTEELGDLVTPESQIPIEQIWSERSRILSNLLCFENFDLILSEMFPFGRFYFRFEILDLLQKNRMKKRPAKVVCSLRDILVEKENGLLFEQRAVKYCNQYVDLVLHHSDPNFIHLRNTFGHFDDLTTPVRSTGYVAKKEFFVSEPNRIPTITLSVGNGSYKEGEDLISCMLEVSDLLYESIEHQLNIYTGPFIAKQFQSNSPQIKIDTFTNNFIRELAKSHVSVSLGGSTLMDLLLTGTPGLVYPYQNNREQYMRTTRLNQSGQFHLLTSSDLNIHTLTQLLTHHLREYKRFTSSVNLNGASNSKKYILDLL